MRGAEVIACPVEAPLPGRSEGARGVERQRLEGIESNSMPAVANTTTHCDVGILNR